MSQNSGDLHEIKKVLKDRVEALCKALLPTGRREGRLWVSHDPVERDFDKLPALKVALDGDAGAWKNWRVPDVAKGDVIGLIAYVERTDTKGALAWARDWLGIRRMSREERAAMRFAAEAGQKKQEEKARKDRAHRLAAAERLFREGTIAAGSTTAAERHARAYFAERGCALEDVPNLAALTFRFSPATEWWRGAQWRQEGGRRIRVSPGPDLPAVHTGMRAPTGIVTACHCLFLDPVRPAKAPVAQPKLMFGEAKGAVIELATGPAGKPFWQTERPAPVILAEGNETGLSLAIAAPEARVWAVGSISGFGSAPVWLACVAEIYAAFDNADNATARRQNEAALEALEMAGKPVAVMKSHLGSDFNDLM